MKKTLRYIAALPVIIPFACFFIIARPFVGREKAAQLCGPAITRIAKRFLHLVIPKITRPEEFDLFREQFKNNAWIWSPMYDFDIAEENENLLKMRVNNCPFCELLTMAGIPEMNKFVCQGDWELAKDNHGLWEFERIHEIAKGDSFCDHTYKRIGG